MILLKVNYISNWYEGVIETAALLNIETGEVSDIDMEDQGLDFEHFLIEQIEFDNEIYNVLNFNKDLDYSISDKDLKKIKELVVIKLSQSID